MTNPPIINNYNTFHLWEDGFLVTVCGLAKELVVLPPEGSIVSSCENCQRISAGYVWMAPTPAEQAMLDFLFPNA